MPALTEKEMYLLLIDDIHAKTILSTLYKLHILLGFNVCEVSIMIIAGNGFQRAK